MPASLLPMILLIPEARVCPEKETRYPVTDFNPIRWIKAADADFIVTGVDGFIVTDQNTVNGIFKKFEYIEEEPGETISIEAIQSVFPESENRLIYNLSALLNCRSYTFFWPLKFPVGYDSNSKLIHLYLFDFKAKSLQVKTHKLISLKDLEIGIKHLRRFSFSKVKPLNSSSSDVECFLANNTKNPWPGDIDAVIYDRQKKKYAAFIEFKTHNIDKKTSQEHIGKYGQQDWRRFDVLFDFIDNLKLKLGYKPKLFFIVWGTDLNKTNHADLKIDCIERNKIIGSYLFPRPQHHNFSQELFDFILKEANESADP